MKVIERMRSMTESALSRRVNQVLAKDGERLRKSRGERAIQELGDYYVMNDKQLSHALQGETGTLRQNTAGCLVTNELKIDKRRRPRSEETKLKTD